jgi:hypothetical protein
MDTSVGQWSAGITCEKTLETHTYTGSNKYNNAREITTVKEWKVIDMHFDMNITQPVTCEQVCPYCGQTVRVTVTPRKDLSLTKEEVQGKFAARMNKRLMQLLLAILITAAFLPGLLMGDSTLLVIGAFVAMVGAGMLFYFTVLLFRIIRTKSKYHRDGTVPINFYMVNPYSVAINDPTNTHFWKIYRKNDIKLASPLEYADMPPMGNIDEIPQFNKGLARL